MSVTRSEASPGARPFLIAELACAGLTGTVINTSVTVSVAAIAEDFDASISDVALLVVLLNVAMAFAMPLAGVAVRAVGPRRLLVLVGAGVIGSSVAFSLSPNLAVLGVARAAQGAAVAGLIPTSVLAAGQLLDGEHRRRALGWWAASNGLGLAFAPLIGGMILDAAGWRWVTVPTCVLGVVLMVTATLAIPPGLRHDPGVEAADVVPVSLLTGSAMSAIAALSVGAWPVAAALVAMGIVAFVLVRRRASRSPALRAPIGWLRDLAVRRTSTGAALQMIANGMVQVGVPAWLIASGVLSAGPAGATLMAMTLTMAAMGPITGRAARVAYDRWYRVGLVGCAAGLGLVAAATSWRWWVVLPGLVILGVGAGALLSPSLTAFSHTVAGENALGLAVFNVARLGSFAVGGLAGAAALDLGSPWVAFAVAGVVCLAAAGGGRRAPSSGAAPT